MPNNRKLDDEIPVAATGDKNESPMATPDRNPDIAPKILSSATSTSVISKEKKRTHQNMQDDDIDDSNGGGSSLSCAPSSVTTPGEDASRSEGTVAKKISPVTRTNNLHDNQDNQGSSVELDSQIDTQGKEGETHHSSVVAKKTRRKKKTFDERLAELAAFKEKHGHCNVPRTPSSDYLSLSQWCNNVMVSYRKIQEGKIPNRPLSQDQIDRLKVLGFEWSRNSTFEERLADLAAFKAKHGHCNPPYSTSSEYKSLSQWCGHVRHCNKQIQEGKTPNRPFTKDQIGKLEALGFDWVVRNNTCTRFEKRIADLAEFKAKYGHCNPPYSTSSEYKSLGQWCNHVRCCNKQIQEGKTPIRPLSKDQIDRLEELGFQWRTKPVSRSVLD